MSGISHLLVSLNVMTGILVSLAALTIASLVLLSPKPRIATALERQFIDQSTKTLKPFPSFEGSSKESSSTPIHLSVIVPAYQEQDRLPTMIQEAVQVLDSRQDADHFSYEIIIVDDGSKDKTTEIALGLSKTHAEKYAKNPQRNATREIRVMTLERNRGKGGAVTQGILGCRGDFILFADADGASKFEDLAKLEKELAANKTKSLGIAIGSRAHMVDSESVVKRSFIRNFLMRGFHLVVYILGIQSIKDTQCGFKLFTRQAAQLIFPCMHVEGWIFDIEILVIAEKLCIPVTEVPIDWHEVDGSKMSLLRDSIEMLVQLLMIRLNYFFGLWTIKKQSRK